MIKQGLNLSGPAEMEEAPVNEAKADWKSTPMIAVKRAAGEILWREDA